MKPLVSVIIPTYNCGKFIQESVQSVINQTVDDWEIQLVDDCSTDNTKDIIDPFLKRFPNIHYYLFKNNYGPAVARSEAIKQAKGKYCAFLDSDDIWMPDKIERQISFMEKNKIDFSCSAYRLMGIQGNDFHRIIIPPAHTSYKKCILLSNPISNLTAVYNQDSLGKFVVPPIKKRNDFALWLQILKKTEFCYGLKDVLASYRTGRTESVSHNKFSQAKYHWELYHNIEKHNVLRSLFEMGCWAFVKGTKLGIKTQKA